MNSREKGKRGERQWRDELRAYGFTARRGQQFAGGAESPDVVCEELNWIHFEVKAVERLNVQEAFDQAKRDAAKSEIRNPKAEIRRVPILAHRRSFCDWLVTMKAETLFKFLCGMLPPEGTSVPATNGAARQEINESKEDEGLAYI